MYWGGHIGGLELRNSTDGVSVLSGKFPYAVATTLLDSGNTVHKEQIAPRAFSRRIESGEDIHFLSGHDQEKPIASRSAGTLTLAESDNELTFEARISQDMQAVSWVRDLLTAIGAGLVRGISPGFRVPTEANAERIETQPGAILRTIQRADLFELSAVTRPAYPQAQIEARSWTPDVEPMNAGLIRTLEKWRA